MGNPDGDYNSRERAVASSSGFLLLTGLFPGDDVILRATEGLFNGTLVNLQDPDAPNAPMWQVKFDDGHVENLPANELVLVDQDNGVFLTGGEVMDPIAGAKGTLLALLEPVWNVRLSLNGEEQAALGATEAEPVVQEMARNLRLADGIGDLQVGRSGGALVS